MEETKPSDEILSEDKLVLLTAVSNNAPTDIITSLLSPSNINVQDNDSFTALHVAVREKRWELVPVLLQHGADVNLGNDCLETPLHFAVLCGAPADIITRLISPHNINMQDEYGDTVLHEVVREKRWELVPVLLQHGADINMGNDYLETPLYKAAYHGAPVDILTQLISSHNINMQDETGGTVLHWAVNGERWELVPVLLQHGADVNLGNNMNQTPLHRAAYRDAPADIITQLISPRNINMQDRVGDKEGYTMLYWAVKEERWELVPVLLQHGADPFIRGILPKPPQPLSLQSLTIATIRSHIPVKSDEVFERLGLPQRLLPELKLKPLADEILDKFSIFITCIAHV